LLLLALLDGDLLCDLLLLLDADADADADADTLGDGVDDGGIAVPG